LPNEISERPSLREPSARRDEGVDEHPQPKNNAAIAVCGPESSSFSIRFGNDLWQSVYALILS
jgi:hypothetical protein